MIVIIVITTRIISDIYILIIVTTIYLLNAKGISGIMVGALHKISNLNLTITL